MMKKFHKTKHSYFLTVAAMETRNKIFKEIGGKLSKKKSEIDTFPVGLSDMVTLKKIIEKQ